jgi:ABC-type antimicrobial peptide transport system permease subunit
MKRSIQTVGRRFRTVDANGADVWREIVGVVPDLGLSLGDPAVAAGYYIPLDSGRDQARFIYLAMRVAGDPSSYIDPLTQAVYDRDPNVVLNQPQPLEDVAGYDRTFFLWFSRALTAIGIVTLILALAGVYAMMALIVTKRTREIGIRIAMGATARRAAHRGGHCRDGCTVAQSR